MNDLHKPLGASGKNSRAGQFVLPSLIIVGICALSLLTYFVVDARNEQSTVVAVNDSAANRDNSAPARTTPSLNADDTDLAPTDAPDANILDENGEIDLSKVKPLSPLEPLQPIDVPDSAQPSFQPAPQTPNRVSDWMPLPDLVEKSEFGQLPKISDGNVRPLDAYAQRSGIAGANRVAIILGGLGLSQTGTQSAISTLPSSVSLGFSPFGNSLQRWMQLARREGHEVILQLAMEPLGYPSINPGPRTLTSVASAGENLKNLRWSLGRMTNYPLVMNYLGAGLIGKDAQMRPLLQEIKSRGLGFIDDGSVSSSSAANIARDIRLPHATGNIVIDANRSPDRIRANLQSLEALAKSRGYAIATATAFPETVTIVNEWLKAAEKRGILVVPASNLIKDFGR